MANEITITANLAATKEGITVTKTASAVQHTLVAALNFVQRTQLVGTAAEAIDTGDLGTPIGWCWMKNHDPTNSINIRAGAAGADLVKLKPGEAQIFRLASDTPYAIASAGTPKLEYLLLPD